MGACLSQTHGLPDHMQSAKIDRDLGRLAAVESHTLKILLLGTGSSGKSTFLKQFKILHTQQGLGDTSVYRSSISYNIISSLLRVGEFAKELTHLSTKVAPLTEELLPILRGNRDKDLWGEIVFQNKPVQIWYICQKLWLDPCLREAFKDPACDIEVPLSYFMEKITDIKEEGYQPSEQDILHVRQRTTGVVSIPIMFGEAKIQIIDVGGQRNERKKWISHFDNVTTLLYIVSLDDFDKMMLEDSTKNRMEDSLEVFEYIATCPFFEKTNMILIFNKKDLLLKRIRDEKISLAKTFPDYTGEVGDYRAAVNYIRKRFTDIFHRSKQHLPSSERPHLETHNTVGTDTTNVKQVLKSCKHIILCEELKSLER